MRTGGDVSGTPHGELLVVGATGRIGRPVVAGLAGRGFHAVPVGRRRESLEPLRAGVCHGPGEVVVADGAVAVAAAVRQRRPAVVVNLLGDYARTAGTLIDAVISVGGCYVDLAADLDGATQLIGRHADAVAAGSTLVTGAGFGVLATEAVVAKLCADRPAPAHVRVDALASVGGEAGRLGGAYASSIVDAITLGGRRYDGGRLVRSALGADPRTVLLPDGETVRSAGAATAELIAAQRASGAPSVSVTSALAPTAPLVRAALPPARALLSIGAVRRAAVRRLAGTRVRAAPRPRRHSWGHAVVTWPGGTSREGWLRADDGMDYTAAAVTDVATRLARGVGRPGAHTPAAVFGPDLAVSAGATFLIDH